MTWSRSAAFLFAGVVLALAIAAAIGVEIARACSCALLDPRDRLEEGTAAVVGHVTARRATDADGRGYAYTIAVERALNAELGAEVEVEAGANEGACGFTWMVGEPIGAFLYREEGRWTTNLCNLVDRADLDRALVPFPPALGRGTSALLVGGNFGGARLMALDRRGRILGYGLGRGEVTRISVCPGSRRSVELVDRGSRAQLAIRTLTSLRILRAARVPASTSVVHCADDAASVVISAGVDYPGKRSRGRVRLLRTTARSTSEIGAWGGYQVALSRRFAYLAGGRRLLRVDLRSGVARRVASIRSPQVIEASPSGRQVAVSTRLGLRVIRSSGGDRSLRIRSPWALGWLGKDRLLARVNGEARIYGADLALRRRFRFYRAQGQANVGRRIYGTDRYRLVALELGSGRRITVATLPDPGTLAIEAVRGAPRLDSPPRSPTAAARAARCAQPS